jgi:hypothetical protein
MPLLTMISGLITKVPKNILMYAIASIFLVFAYKYIKHSIYMEGYDAAMRDMDIKYQASFELSVEAYKQRSDELVLLEQEKARIVSAALQKLEKAPKEIEVREVVKIVESSDCKRLSDEYVELLNGSFSEDFFE